MNRYEQEYGPVIYEQLKEQNRLLKKIAGEISIDEVLREMTHKERDELFNLKIKDSDLGEIIETDEELTLTDPNYRRSKEERIKQNIRRRKNETRP